MGLYAIALATGCVWQASIAFTAPTLATSALGIQSAHRSPTTRFITTPISRERRIAFLAFIQGTVTARCRGGVGIAGRIDCVAHINDIGVASVNQTAAVQTDARISVSRHGIAAATE